MLINRISLISFSATPKGTGKVTGGVGRALGKVEERVRRGEISDSDRKFLQGLEDARKKGELRPDGRKTPPPGMPDDAIDWD